ncbi:MAG: o-succinylbenzoate synthase [Bacteroidota bacterium]|nr:o-succinylbenzoate synthase [Bacteroidota bacterium]
MKASFKKYQLQFTEPVLTSRGQMAFKNGYYLSITDGQNTGTGECSFIEGLSIDDLANYELVLEELCKSVEDRASDTFDLNKFPSIKFGLETALLDLKNGGRKVLFENEFTKGKKLIPINGLVWMGNKDFMFQQINTKLEAGFKCIKIKVGAIDFDEELNLLEFIRQKFPADTVEIRLDANGAFNKADVFKKLDDLSKYNIHSIEQPVKQGQLELMKKICKNSPIPVALDEELINPPGITPHELLSAIMPQYIILKPSLLGGIENCRTWINSTQQLGIKWWATSALESNIGLNAIAQWVFTENSNMVQGLGTGGLYVNNISSPLYITNGQLAYNPDRSWGSI